MSDTHTNGADPAAASEPAPQPETQPAPNDFESRIKSDPEFALDQYNKMKSENTKLFQKTKKHEPVIRLAEQYGADQIQRWLGEYDAILKHPEVTRVVEHFRRQGTLPTVNDRPQSTKETFEDLFPDPQAQELGQLRAELASLKSQVVQTRTAVGKQNIAGMLSQLKQEHPDGFEDFVLPALRERMDEWEKTPQGRELLANLDYDQLKTVAGRAWIENRDAIYEKMHARKLLELKRGATGAPAPNLSTGRESAPRSSGYVSMQEALREFEQKEGPLMRR